MDKFWELARSIGVTKQSLDWAESNGVEIELTEDVAHFADPGRKKLWLTTKCSLDKMLSALVHEVHHIQQGPLMTANWEQIKKLKEDNWNMYMGFFLSREFDAYRAERKALRHIRRRVPLGPGNEQLFHANTDRKLAEHVLRVQIGKRGYLNYIRSSCNDMYDKALALPEEERNEALWS